ncbi:uncharacterized protein LOC105439722 isoform X1 [Strongylocentrotus purpuratus]|uniref:Uncharacterized protein n=1 Tax=Strongylocentrotus purpuratus TaxID=7668 RepID=A0A7M7NDS6_STRPU|nr:uncharacterized protein LOC105439722 isoform X1 [Strongylocentrotus purpuratus]
MCILVGERNLDKKAGQTEGTETGNAAIEEEVHQQITPINKQGTSQNREEIKSSGIEAKDTNNVVAEISEEDNPSNKKKDANHGKESDKAPEEEASLNNNGTDGEQVSLDDDFEHVSKEDVVQEMSRDGAAASKENTTVNVDTKEQGNTSDGSDEHRREESSKTPLQVKAISRTQAFS